MTSNMDVIRRWVQVSVGKQKRYLSPERCSVKVIGDNLYSYGSHFELARRLSDGVFLCNGDTWGSFTGRQQGQLRNVLDGDRRWNGKTYATHTTAYDRVVIPYSALNAAGIDLDSIKIIEKRDDHSIEVLRNGASLPNHLFGYWRAANYPRSFAGDDHSKPIHGPANQNQIGYWFRGAMGYAKKTPEMCRQEWDKIKDDYAVSFDESTKRWHWTDHRHQLGECVFDCELVVYGGSRRQATFISAWDNQDTGTYFLSELPHPVASLDGAYEALKPQTVRLAELEGKRIVRQGDIFAVETDLTTRQVKALVRPEDMLPGVPHSINEHITKMGNLLGTNHKVTEQVVLPSGAVLARGILHHKPPFRDPDHRRQWLGKKWHVIVKNTVPVMAPPHVIHAA